MANTNKPFGLRPVGTMNGSDWNNSVRTYHVPATDTTAIFIGDPVTLAGSEGGSVADGPNYPTCTKGASTGVWAGVVVGIEPLYTDHSVLYRKASTAMNVRVCTDPNTIFQIQGNSGTWDGDDVGANANITVSTGSTTTGTSNAVLDQTTVATTATLDFQILGSDTNVGNDTSGAYPLILVRLNNHQFVDGTTGI